MKNRTTRLVRILADIRRAQHCTALRAARAAADIDRALKEPAEPEAERDGDEGDTQDAQAGAPGTAGRTGR